MEEFWTTTESIESIVHPIKFIIFQVAFQTQKQNVRVVILMTNYNIYFCVVTSGISILNRRFCT